MRLAGIRYIAGSEPVPRDVVRLLHGPTDGLALRLGAEAALEMMLRLFAAQCPSCRSPPQAPMDHPARRTVRWAKWYCPDGHGSARPWLVRCSPEERAV